MRKLALPRTDMSISAACLGTAYFGSREDESTSFEMLDYFASQGGNFINTAHEYGRGESERLIGRWLKSNGNRGQMIITSKCGEDHAAPGQRAMRYHQIIEDADESLERLDVDSIDILLMHIDDTNVPAEEIVDALAKLVSDGKIRYYGCSNWSPERIEQAAAYARATGKPEFIMDEIEWNLAVRNDISGSRGTMWMDEEYYAYHKKTALTVGAYSPMAQGVFSKMLAGTMPEAREWQRNDYENSANRATAQRLSKLSGESGYSVAELQIAYICSRQRDFAAFPIVGASRLQQLVESLRGVDIVLGEEMIKYLRGDTDNT